MSTTKYEMVVSAASRQELTNAIDIALITGGTRIGKGKYEVAIRRLSKKEVEKMEKEEQEERDASRTTSP